MEAKELVEKAQRNLAMLTGKMQGIDQQRQQILSEICRYQGEVRVLTSVMEPKEDKEGDRPAEGVEKAKRQAT